MENLQDILLEQLKDLYSAETQLIEALPKMAEGAESNELKRAFTSHLEETKTHQKRLLKIGKMLEESLEGHTCQAMKGLVKEGSEVLDEDYDSPALRDVMLVAAAQRVEHYEIAGYGNAIALADYLGIEDVVALLEETIEEEGDADSALTQLCQSELFDACGEALDDDEEVGEEDEDENVKPSEKRV